MFLWFHLMSQSGVSQARAAWHPVAMRWILILAMLLAGCSRNETVTAYGALGQTWELVELDGLPTRSVLTITFPEKGTITGQTSCARFSGKIVAPYPWFELDRLQTEAAGCIRQTSPDLIEKLQSMTQSEVSGSVLALRNEKRQEMVFRSSP